MDIGPIGQRDLMRRNHRRRNAFYYRGSLHPDTIDWLARVAAVGGSVSGSTIAAVDQFARSIDSAGIRSRFLRLNLFCGSTLTTALVPFYRGETVGAANGNATDTNTNFVAADYTEAGGIRGKSTAYLSPGLNSSLITATNSHVSVASTAASADIASGNRDLGVNTNNAFGLIIRFNGTFNGYWRSKGNDLGFENQSFTSEVGHFVAVRDSASSAFVSRNGSVILSPGVHTGTNGTDGPIYIFAQSTSGTEQSKRRFGAYSLGHSLTTAQAAQFSAAMSAFCAALGRPLS